VNRSPCRWSPERVPERRRNLARRMRLRPRPAKFENSEIRRVISLGRPAPASCTINRRLNLQPKLPGFNCFEPSSIYPCSVVSSQYFSSSTLRFQGRLPVALLICRPLALYCRSVEDVVPGTSSQMFLELDPMSNRNVVAQYTPFVPSFCRAAYPVPRSRSSTRSSRELGDYDLV
jgi:hypothetical protein